MNARRTGWSSVAAAALAVHCGSGGSGTSPHDASSPDDGVGWDGGATPDGSGDDTSGAEAGVCDAPGDAVSLPQLNPKQFGSVAIFTQNTIPGTSNWSWGAAASFTSNPTAVSGQSTSASAGPCRTTVYVNGGQPGTPAQVSGGVITITISGQSGPIVLKPWSMAASGYLDAAGSSQLWNGGETVQVVAAGDVVPAFDWTAVAPDAIAVQSPPLPSGCPGAACSRLPIDRSNDMTFAWVAAVHGVARVTFASDATSTGGKTIIDCWYPMNAGTGVVPTAILQTLPSGGVGLVQVTSSSAEIGEIVDDAGWTIDMTLTGSSTWGTQDVFPGLRFSATN